MAQEGLTPEQEVDKLLTLANLQRMRSQWSEAEQTLRKALGFAPDDAGIHEMLGDVLHECGKLDMSLSEYRSAMELAPGKVAVETKYANVTLEIGDREYERALAQDMIDNPHRYVTRAKKPMIALLSSTIVPGLGQLYNNEVVKALLIFGPFVLFLIAMAVFPFAGGGVTSLADLISRTNPVVLILGFIAVGTYIYGIADAYLTADKSRKNAKKTEHLISD